MTRKTFIVCLLFMTTVLVPGCGGGGGGSSNPIPLTPGSISGSIDWSHDGRSRLIPEATNSLLITVTDFLNNPHQFLAARPADGSTSSRFLLDNIYPGPATLRVEAYPETDATGVAQALASVNTTVVAGQTVVVNLTLGSTISQVKISPNPVSVVTDHTSTVVVTATNSFGDVVIVGKHQWLWSPPSPDPGLYSMIATEDHATITGISPGTTTISVMDKESGKTDTGQVVLTQNPGSIDVTVK